MRGRMRCRGGEPQGHGAEAVGPHTHWRATAALLPLWLSQGRAPRPLPSDLMLALPAGGWQAVGQGHRGVCFLPLCGHSPGPLRFRAWGSVQCPTFF